MNVRKNLNVVFAMLISSLFSKKAVHERKKIFDCLYCSSEKTWRIEKLWMFCLYLSKCSVCNIIFEKVSSWKEENIQFVFQKRHE